MLCVFACSAVFWDVRRRDWRVAGPFFERFMCSYHFPVIERFDVFVIFLLIQVRQSAGFCCSKRHRYCLVGFGNMGNLVSGRWIRPCFSKRVALASVCFSPLFPGPRRLMVMCVVSATMPWSFLFAKLRRLDSVADLGSRRSFWQLSFGGAAMRGFDLSLRCRLVVCVTSWTKFHSSVTPQRRRCQTHQRFSGS